MYMKKVLSFIIVLLLTIVFMGNVKAKNNELEVTNVEILEKSDEVKANIEDYKDLNINLNTLFFSKDDYVKYKITIKNNTKNTMKIDDILDNFNSEVLETIYDIDKKEIKTNEEYTFTLTMKCIKDIEEEKVTITSPLNIITYFIIFVLSAISLLLVITKRGKKQLLGLMIIVSLIPIGSNAVSTSKTLIINNDIKVYGKVANFESGIVGNKKLKELAGTDTSTSDNAYSVVDTNIKKVLRAQSLPENFISTEENTISTEESRVPIYVWFDNGTIYYYSENEKILLNDNSNRLFQNLTALEEIDLSNFDTSNVTSMSAMFSNCGSLESLDLSSFDTSNVTSLAGMFNYCTKLKQLDLSNFDTSNVTSIRTMFQRCESLEEVDLSNFNTSKVTDMAYLFNNDINLKNINISNFDTSNVSSMRSMFYNCSKLTELDVSKFDTSNVEEMNFMFMGCSSLKSIDVSNFNTSKVTTMKSMFNNCNSLEQLDISNFDTSNVTDMSFMFQKCNNLKTLNMSKFDTSNVTDMSYMFNYCNSLTELDVSSFNTSKVTNMATMFQRCDSLKTLNISNFDTSNVTDMRYMFGSCYNLDTIYLGSFSTKRAIYIYNMFRLCSSLKTIYVNNDFEITGDTDSTYMFLDAKNIVGGNGTTYNNSYTNATYARIDTEETPGYFTQQQE